MYLPCLLADIFHLAFCFFFLSWIQVVSCRRWDSLPRCQRKGNDKVRSLLNSSEAFWKHGVILRDLSVIVTLTLHVAWKAFFWESSCPWAPLIWYVKGLFQMCEGFCGLSGFFSIMKASRGKIKLGKASGKKKWSQENVVVTYGSEKFKLWTYTVK